MIPRHLETEILRLYHAEAWRIGTLCRQLRVHRDTVRRVPAGFTQRQLAAQLKRSNSFVWKIEAGERQVNVLEFMEIARILGLRPSALMKEVEGH